MTPIQQSGYLLHTFINHNYKNSLNYQFPNKVLVNIKKIKLLNIARVR